MEKFLLGGRYLWSLLQRQGKDLRRCVKELGLEDHHRATGTEDHLIMDVLVLVHALHAIHQVLEVGTVQGPILLLQDGAVTLYPQLEGVVTTHDHLVTTQDHHEILLLREAVIMNEGHILQVMTMVLGKLKMEKGMTRNLGTRRRLMHEVIGGLLIKHQDHHLVLGPDLPSYHLGAADKEMAM